MKQTFFTLKNNSKSEGTYLIDGEYKVIYPGETISLKKSPTSYTANVSLTLYRKDIAESPILYKKSKKTAKK